ncbi:MAG: DUF2332 domain-containing protein [Solirubrobacteraceae bacterium]
MSTGDHDTTPFGGVRDRDAGSASLVERFRRHADALVHAGRSPLYVELMRGAAVDLHRGGVVRELFDGIPAPPGTVPALRLLATLHRLVLEGRAPELASHYPSVGGTRPPAGAWPRAAASLRERFDEVRERVTLTVQTNEPGRAAVLYGALLWLGERHDLPVRLLEIGASGGLNLLADRFAYRVDGALLGDVASSLIFDEPWEGRPVPDPSATARALRIARRSGCDLAPLDFASAEDRLTLRSYIWADELDRLGRADAALEVATRHQPPVAAFAAECWLPRVLAAPRAGELTVIWQSVVRQYVPLEAWAAIEQAVEEAARAATPDTPLTWLTMEPGEHPLAGFVLSATTWPGGASHRLADAADHGPPVRWHPQRNTCRQDLRRAALLPAEISGR